jgi:hypothetical protein
MKICSTPNYWHLIFKAPFFLFSKSIWPNYIVTLPRYFSFRLPRLNIPTGPPSDEFDKDSQRTWLSENSRHWNGYSHFWSGLNWLECNDIIGSAKGSQISEKYWGEVGKGKGIDVYLEVRKRRGHIFFEWNKCLWGDWQNDPDPPQTNWTRIVSECGLLKISVNETDTTTSSPV